MAGVCIWIALGEKNQGSLGYNIVVTFILFLTLLFANFAEAIAEARGKAQADSLRKTREETPAKKVKEEFLAGKNLLDFINQDYILVTSNQLKKEMFLFVRQTTLFLRMEKLLKVWQQ